MFSLIKNAVNVENVNINNKQKTEGEKETLDLTYDIKPKQIIDKDSIPQVNQIAFNAQLYDEIINKAVSTLDLVYDTLWNNKIIIKNTGNLAITYKDFYKNDKLGFQNSPSIIAIQVNNRTTKKYINAKIVPYENFISIKFDTIEPGDIIELNVLAYQEKDHIELRGKTKDFDKPHKQDKYHLYSGLPKQNIILHIILSVLLLFSILLIVLGSYLERNNLSLYIRNPFILQKVQKDK